MTEQAQRGWASAKAEVKRLQQELDGLSNEVTSTTDLAKLEALFMREQILPSLITAAEAAEKLAYADLLAAQGNELRPELSACKAEALALREKVEPLQKQLATATAEVGRLDAHIRGLLSEERSARVQAENLQVSLRDRARLRRAPAVRALNT